MVSAMGATANQMARRRTSSIVREHGRRGYHSETVGQNQNHGAWLYDPDPAASSSSTTTATKMTRRRSTGYCDQVPSRSDVEVGDSSDTGNIDGYDSCSSYSQSEESTKKQFSDATTTNSPIDTTNPRKSRENWADSRNGNNSDTDLDSNSIRRRALHEAGLPISVLKGNSSSGNIQGNINNNSNLLRSDHSARFRSESDDFQLRTDTLESTLSLSAEQIGRDDSTKSRSSEDSCGAEAGECGGPITTPNTTESSGNSNRMIMWSNLWRSIRKTNPIFLLLVTGVSMLGVGLYTQSYAELSITLEQVISNTHERQKQVAVRFDNIEQKINNIQRQLHEIDPEAKFLMVRGAADDADGSASVSVSHDSADDSDEKLTGANRNPGQLRQSRESVLFDEMVAVKEKMRIKSSQISAFEKFIQDTSFRDATRKYGKGVIRVQLDLVFLSDIVQPTVDQNSNTNRKSQQKRNNSGNGDALRQSKLEDGSDSPISSSHVLVLEMAPLDLMPHSVYTFLEMVDAKLIEGCSFVLNAMNVVKAAPLPYDGSRASQKVKAFTRLGLDTVSFREYSRDYPHEKYTVGFSADGSPDFYINTENNTEQHAGEPCFAKIVSGFETVERMELEPVRSGMWYKKRIGIQKAVII